MLSPQTFSWIADAERHPPTVSTHTTFGVPESVLHTSEGWRSLQALGIREGVVAMAYDAPETGAFSRLHQFVKYHLWTGSCAIVTCPSAMTDGAARLLERQLAGGEVDGMRRKVFQRTYSKLTSRDPHEAWTSGQWMTERAGGSDVRGTETVATYNAALEGDGVTDTDGIPLGPWLVNGFKWFSSATDSQMAILLAQTTDGLSAFFAPMRRTVADSATLETESNGVSIQRLKSKLGTRALPTAELVLHDMRAWPIGQPGRGVAAVATLLNITRVHTALSALGLWARGLAIARAFARVRRIDGGRVLLVDVPAHAAAVAANTLRYSALMQLGFFAASLLGGAEHPHAFEGALFTAHMAPLENDRWAPPLVPDARAAALLLRLLTPVAKAVCSKRAIAGLQECTEALGGLGYLEEPGEQRFNVARLLRDCAVLAIWEGTTDVMAADTVRVMMGRDGAAVRAALEAFVLTRFKVWRIELAGAEKAVREQLDRLMQLWTGCTADELRFRGREVLDLIAWIVCAVLLVEDAERDGDAVAAEMARRWVASGPGDWDSAAAQRLGDWEDAVAMDKLIAFGPVKGKSSREEQQQAKL